MSLYAHIVERRDVLEDFPPGELRFKPVSALPQSLVQKCADILRQPLEEWAAPFASAPQPTVLSVVLDKPHDEAIVHALFTEGPQRKEIIRCIRHEQGYVSRKFCMTARKGRLFNARTSPKARAQGFVPHVMRAFNAIDRRHDIRHVDLSAINLGTYVWLAYGAVPQDMGDVAEKIKTRWTHFSAAMRAQESVMYARELEAWVQNLSEKTTAQDFRKPFSADAPALVKQTLKALILGDTGFLCRPNHNFVPELAASGGHKGIYAAALEQNMTFETRNADFQGHFKAHIDNTLARLPGTPPRL